MRGYRGILIFCCLLIWLSGSATVIGAQSGGSLYFAETGHWVRGEFLNYYQSTSDPLLLLGYPITDELIDPINGQKTQYFQRARLDLEYEEGEDPVIRRAPLGRLIYEEGSPPASVPINSFACKHFPKTGKDVCYAFLQFYSANNGPDAFGEPISDLEYQDGRYVQYFEYARMEWRPDSTGGQRVALTDLGRIYFDTRMGNPQALQPDLSSNTTGKVTELRARAFVGQALLPASTRQTLYVIVQDASLAPVQGASVLVTVWLPNGEKEVYRPAATDADGVSRLSFATGKLDFNQIVPIETRITYQDVQANSKTWFRVWW